MRRKIILVIGLVVVSLCCVAVAVRIVNNRHRPDPDPPFARHDESISASSLYTVYKENEAEGDRLFKRKIIYLYDAEYDKGDVRTDEAGEQYLSVYAITNRTEVLSGGDVVRRAQVARCYLHRPDDPVMEHRKPGPAGLIGHDIKGVCMGKIDGVVVMRKCYLVEVVLEAADW